MVQLAEEDACRPSSGAALSGQAVPPGRPWLQAVPDPAIHQVAMPPGQPLPHAKLWPTAVLPGQPWPPVMHAGSPTASSEQNMRRVIVLRHGSRPYETADPPLDRLGVKQATLVAKHLAQEDVFGELGIPSRIVAIFCSPFTRALQTAEPIARALSLPIFVEWGFSELLAHDWLHDQDPLPELHARPRESLPASSFIDDGYQTVVMPEYPDVVGFLQKGDHKRRAKALQRHRDAVNAALQRANGASILVVAHGSTHDFVVSALCPEQQDPSQQTPFCVDPCGITEIVEREGGRWQLNSFGSTPWATSTPCLEQNESGRDRCMPCCPCFALLPLF